MWRAADRAATNKKSLNLKSLKSEKKKPKRIRTPEK